MELWDTVPAQVRDHAETAGRTGHLPADCGDVRKDATGIHGRDGRGHRRRPGGRLGTSGRSRIARRPWISWRRGRSAEQRHGSGRGAPNWCRNSCNPTAGRSWSGARDVVDRAPAISRARGHPGRHRPGGVRGTGRRGEPRRRERAVAFARLVGSEYLELDALLTRGWLTECSAGEDGLADLYDVRARAEIRGPGIIGRVGITLPSWLESVGRSEEAVAAAQYGAEACRPTAWRTRRRGSAAPVPLALLPGTLGGIRPRRRAGERAGPDTEITRTGLVAACSDGPDARQHRHRTAPSDAQPGCLRHPRSGTPASTGSRPNHNVSRREAGQDHRRPKGVPAEHGVRDPAGLGTLRATFALRRRDDRSGRPRSSPGG